MEKNLTLKKVKKLLEDLLEGKKVDINLKDNNGCTALIWASYQGYKKIVEFLISHGSDINEKNNNGETPLMIVSERGYKEIVELLISYGADKNI